ncbi:MAG: hypothetical protein ISR45_04155 [Rhodospirillales bacterium]|nr:hypothetical protein [Rhodospirillales bacterium]
MQALKGLVAGMAILIVIAMSTIAYGLYRKSDDPDFKFFSLGGDKAPQTATQPPALPVPATQNVTTPGAAPKAFGDVMLSLPPGCTISAVSGDGVRIFMKIGPAGPDCERVIVVDAANGSLLGTLMVSP